MKGKHEGKSRKGVRTSCTSDRDRVSTGIAGHLGHVCSCLCGDGQGALVTRLAPKIETRKHQRPPLRVAVFTLYYSHVSSPLWAPTPHWAMDRQLELLPTTSPPALGGAWQRIFQLLRHKRDHHLPPCTAVVWLAAHAPNRKGAKGLTKRCQALRLGLRPGRHLASSSLLASTRGSRQAEIYGAF